MFIFLDLISKFNRYYGTVEIAIAKYTSLPRIMSLTQMRPLFLDYDITKWYLSTDVLLHDQMMEQESLTLAEHMISPKGIVRLRLYFYVDWYDYCIFTVVLLGFLWLMTDCNYFIGKFRVNIQIWKNSMAAPSFNDTVS